MAQLYNIRPWEWDGETEESRLSYGMTLRLCASIDRHRAEANKHA